MGIEHVAVALADWTFIIVTFFILCIPITCVVWVIALRRLPFYFEQLLTETPQRVARLELVVAALKEGRPIPPLADAADTQPKTSTEAKPHSE